MRKFTIPWGDSHPTAPGRKDPLGNPSLGLEDESGHVNLLSSPHECLGPCYGLDLKVPLKPQVQRWASMEGVGHWGRDLDGCILIPCSLLSWLPWHEQFFPTLLCLGASSENQGVTYFVPVARNLTDTGSF